MDFGYLEKTLDDIPIVSPPDSARWCIKNQQFWTNISLCSRNCRRYSHEVYRMVLVPVTLSDPNYPQNHSFCKFCITFPILGTTVQSRRNTVEENFGVFSLIWMHQLPSARSCGQQNLSPTRNTFCGTWYLPHSWVHYDQHCHLVFMSQLLTYLEQTRLRFSHK